LIKPVLIWKDLAPHRIPKLESGEERYVYGKLIAGILVSGTPILNTYRSLPDSKLKFRWTLPLAGFQIGIQKEELCIWKAH
jgi:hypothetical protein